MASPTYHIPRQEPTPADQPESHPVDKITWVYVVVGIVPVVFLCCGIIHYIRVYRRKKLQGDKPVDIEMKPGEVQFTQIDWEDQKITKVTGNPNSVWNQLESMTTEQLAASSNPRGSWQPTPDIYGFGDNAANDRGARYGDITGDETDLVRPPIPAANPARLSQGESDALRSVSDGPGPIAGDEPSPRSSLSSSSRRPASSRNSRVIRPVSSVYSQDGVELPPLPPMPAIDETTGDHFSQRGAEIDHIVNTQVLAPADYDEMRQALFEHSKRHRLAKRTATGASSPQDMTPAVERRAHRRTDAHGEHRKHRTKKEHGRRLGEGRRKRDSARRRRSRSVPPSSEHCPAENDRLEHEARRRGRERERRQSRSRGDPAKKNEKPSGWLDKLAERMVTVAIT